MPEIVIECENLGKKYKIGSKEKYLSLRDSLVNTIKFPYRVLTKKESLKKKELWALKDVSFKVKKGEVIGIIGRNGAGKSTLLKLLSRITEPTEGKIILRGRIASLLEVGTGFHDELTGRENICLNGSVLGMRRKEINKKFDEIVDFSGVKKFLDTPIKRYSSGMKVRLAFAVAAHLEPEILLIDEVLAVGDVEFQKKCLGKMEDVAASGRTVLFVSHNMLAVESLCSKAIVLENGKNVFEGTTNEAIAQYMKTSEQLAKLSLNERTDRTGNGKLRVTDCIIGIEENKECGYWQTGKDCIIQFKYTTDISEIKNVDVGISLFTQTGKKMFSANTVVIKKRISLKKNKGTITCKIKKMPINSGSYYITYDVYSGGILLDKVENAIFVTMENGDFYGTGIVWGGYGTVLTNYEWY